MGVDRKGYVHALEGVIAALIVVVYLTSIVSVPGTTNWEKSRVSKQSSDLLSAMDRSGFLDAVVLRDDPASFNAFVSNLDSSLAYSVQVTGLPKRFIDIGVMVGNASTFRVASDPGSDGATGIPASEDGQYRHGTLSTHPDFGDVPFVLSDTADNGIQSYTSVNFDFDTDDDFSGSGEGPFNFTDRFTCDAAVEGCSGSQVYEVGPSNTTLTLYNASTVETLQAREGAMDIGRRTVDINVEAVNPFDETVEAFDALWVEDWSAAEIAERDSVFRDFLRKGRMLMIHSAVDREAIDDNYLSTLGFDHLSQFSVLGSGSTENVLYSLHGPRNESYRSAQYYVEDAIQLDTFTDVGGREEGEFALQDGTVTVRRWSDGTVAFSSESFNRNYSAGEEVSIERNTYTIEETDPLTLNPSGQQRFASFDTTLVDADYYATRMKGRSYNITQEDTSASITQEFQNRSDLPQNFDQGPVNTVCDWRDEPYRLGEVTVSGTTYDFLLVNFEPQGSCDEYAEFAYFDLAGDDDFDDDAGGGSSEEGPYQKGDVVNVSGKRFRVLPHLDGQGLDLTRVGTRLVGEVPVSRDVFGRGGSAALVRRQSLGHDDVHLLASIIATETQEKQAFTSPRSLGDTSLGYSYTSSTSGETSFGYTLQTVWWLQ